MDNQFFEQIELIIYKVGGTKILREVTDGFTQHLYKLPNELYLIVYKYKEWIQYKFKLGKLRALDSEQPILFVLEDIDLYLKVLYKLNIVDKRNSISNYFNEKKVINIIKDNINLILNNYDVIIKDNYFIENVRRIENKLDKIELVLDEKVEDTIKELRNKTNGKGLILHIESFIGKTTVIDKIYDQIGIVEIGIVVVIISAIIVFIPIFTNMEMSEIPEGIFILLSCVLLGLLGGVILLINKLKNKNNKGDS